MKKEEKKTQKASVKERMDAGVAGNKKEEKGKIEREKKTEAAEKKESRQTAEKVKAEETKVEEKAKTPEHVKMPEKAKAEGKQALAESKQEEDMERYLQRLNRHLDELKWLYMELYDNDSMFFELCENMRLFYQQRNLDLKKLDQSREQKPDWYKQNDMLGMMFYIDNFAGNMKGVKEKLGYLEESNVNYIHLMPFLDTPKGRSDGGYAVSDFRKVQESLGTMEDLEELTAACHQKGINVCMDFVMNHTSEDHEWAKRARQERANI